MSYLSTHYIQIVIRINIDNAYGICFFIFKIILIYFFIRITVILNYIDYLVTYEALYDQEEAIREIYDYAKMASRISNKYDKYPRNFLTTFRITTRNYSRLKGTFDEQDFKKIKEHNYKNMEWEYGNYVFLYPENTQTIKDEVEYSKDAISTLFPFSFL